MSQVLICRACGWAEATADGFCLECAAPETFEDAIGCDMCGAHIDDPCDCFDPQSERRFRHA
jgi:predicted amidophosphoribosyltransferase